MTPTLTQTVPEPVLRNLIIATEIHRRRPFDAREVMRDTTLEATTRAQSRLFTLTNLAREHTVTEAQFHPTTGYTESDLMTFKTSSTNQISSINWTTWNSINRSAHIGLFFSFQTSCS